MPVLHLGRSKASPRSSEKLRFSEIPKSFGFREFQKAALFEKIGRTEAAIIENRAGFLDHLFLELENNAKYFGPYWQCLITGHAPHSGFFV